MKKILIICIAFVLTISLTACVGLQRGDDPILLATADFGQYPENLEQIIKDHLKISLFDPYSVRDFEIKKPKQSWYRHAGFRQPVIYGYETRVYLNAKNRMGGYTGLKKHFVFVRNGQIINFREWNELLNPDRFNAMPEKMVR